MVQWSPYLDLVLMGWPGRFKVFHITTSVSLTAKQTKDFKYSPEGTGSAGLKRVDIVTGISFDAIRPGLITYQLRNHPQIAENQDTPIDPSLWKDGAFPAWIEASRENPFGALIQSLSDFPIDHNFTLWIVRVESHADLKLLYNFGRGFIRFYGALSGLNDDQLATLVANMASAPLAQEKVLATIKRE